MNELFLAMVLSELGMYTYEQLEDILSKDEPCVISMYKSNVNGTFTEHQVSTRKTLNILLRVWDIYE